MNQVWNWVRGEGEREVRWRVPLRYWEGARPPGATGGGEVSWWGAVRWGRGREGEGGCTDELVCGGCGGHAAG